MFDSLSSATVKGVASENQNVTKMNSMFYQSPSTSLDVSHLDTSNVTTMMDMFAFSKAAELDLRSFNTANVTNMGYMFFSSMATVLDVSTFNTAKVSGMTSMFESTKATVLDLSNFDTWSVGVPTNMFRFTTAQTGYARNATDAAKLNASDTKRPSGLAFIVREQPVQYELATDADFVGSVNGSFRYNGLSQYVVIPETIKGVKVTSYKDMFRDSGVKGRRLHKPERDRHEQYVLQQPINHVGRQPTRHGECDHYDADVYNQQGHLAGLTFVQHRKSDQYGLHVFQQYGNRFGRERVQHG